MTGSQFTAPGCLQRFSTAKGAKRQGISPTDSTAESVSRTTHVRVRHDSDLDRPGQVCQLALWTSRGTKVPQPLDCRPLGISGECPDGDRHRPCPPGDANACSLSDADALRRRDAWGRRATRRPRGPAVSAGRPGRPMVRVDWVDIGHTLAAYVDGACVATGDRDRAADIVRDYLSRRALTCREGPSSRSSVTGGDRWARWSSTGTARCTPSLCPADVPPRTPRLPRSHPFPTSRSITRRRTRCQRRLVTRSLPNLLVQTPRPTPHPHTAVVRRPRCGTRRRGCW